MLGSKTNKGVVPQICESIFERIKIDSQTSKTEYEVRNCLLNLIK